MFNFENYPIDWALLLKAQIELDDRKTQIEHLFN